MNTSDIVNERIPLQTQPDVSVKFNESIFEVKQDFFIGKKCFFCV